MDPETRKLYILRENPANTTEKHLLAICKQGLATSLSENPNNPYELLSETIFQPEQDTQIVVNLVFSNGRMTVNDQPADFRALLNFGIATKRRNGANYEHTFIGGRFDPYMEYISIDYCTFARENPVGEVAYTSEPPLPGTSEITMESPFLQNKIENTLKSAYNALGLQ